jgi:YggT family protein
MLVAGLIRDDVANYLNAAFEVYIIVIVVYVLLNMMFSFGLRPPYSRWTDAVLGFLKDVSDPYLRIFRRVIPSLGMIDLSPMIAIIVLVFLDRILFNTIHS